MNDYILVTYKPDKTKVSGFFDEDDENIYINSNLNKLTKELVFVHESQHKVCFKNKCKCQKNLFWCEYHAFRSEIDFIIDKNIKKYWVGYFNNVIYELKKFKDNDTTYKSHFKSLAKVCRLKRFKKYAIKYKYLKRINSIIEDYYGRRM